jgi:uncharacterized protein YukE
MTMTEVSLEREFYEVMEKLSKILERIADTLDYIEKSLEESAGGG